MTMDGARFEERTAELAERLRQDMETIVCVDSHTGGEPTRLVIGGLPHIEGKTISEKSKFFEKNYDHIRTILTAEPRGRQAMHALILCPPTSEEADFGLIITCALGYLDMCGHGLIGAVSTVIEMGIVEAVEPLTELTVETPSGEMWVQAKIVDGKVDGVTFRNQPAFVPYRDVEIEIPKYGTIKVDVAYGGNWFPIVDAQQLGLELSNKNLKNVGEATDFILEAVRAVITPEHPVLGRGSIDQMVFMGPSRNPTAHSMNLTTSTALGFDRSPCGTGSSAKMAVLHAQGKLGMNEEHVLESATTGSLFRGRLIEATKVGDLDAVVPEITGYAYLTSIQYMLVDDRDSLKHGFSIP